MARCSNFFNPSKKSSFGCAANRKSQRLDTVLFTECCTHLSPPSDLSPISKLPQTVTHVLQERGYSYCFRGRTPPLPIERAGSAMTLYACIREVLGSNLGWDTGYHEVFSWYSSVSPAKFYKTMTRSFQILPNSLLFSDPTTRRNMYGRLINKLIRCVQ
jgi:hypothetical protein